uniref:Uncharacterized protein n=1 Tax=Caenorhabditis japonica TaxID=281687 RepID=A0A8R1ECL4_CAEJA
MRSIGRLAVLLTIVFSAAGFNKESIQECAQVLSEHIKETFSKISHETILRQNYDKLVEEEQFDPRQELKRSKHRIEDYLKVRSQFAYNVHILETVCMNIIVRAKTYSFACMRPPNEPQLPVIGLYQLTIWLVPGVRFANLQFTGH